MNKLRIAGIGLAAVTAVSLAACSNGSSNSPSSSSSSSSTSVAMSSSNDGVTKVSDTFGPACDKIPSDGKGSLNGMASDPVAVAASNNPLLTKLVAAVKAANLVDTLDSQKAITVFAPYDAAFQALGDDTFNSLAKDPAKLTPILTYHVLPQRFNADQLTQAGTEATLQKGQVKITGNPKDGMKINDANVLCGNIPTGNATVFVIDKVLTPPAS